MKHFPFFALYEVFEIQGVFCHQQHNLAYTSHSRKAQKPCVAVATALACTVLETFRWEGGGRVEMTSAGPSQLPDYI